MLRWTTSANRDLVRWHGFLEAVDRRAAARVVRRILDGVKHIARHPRMGARLAVFDPREALKLIGGDYELRYEVREDALVILRIWHVHEDRWACPRGPKATAPMAGWRGTTPAAVRASTIESGALSRWATLWFVPLYLVGVAVVSMIAVSALGAWAQRRPRREGASAPIGSIVDSGPARVRGEVACADPLIAPSTGRRCAYVRLELHFEAMGRVHGYQWSARHDFSIADASGRAEVLVERAGFEVVADIVHMGRVTDLTAAQRATIAKLRWPLPEVGSVELCEAVVEVGATVEVAGVAACDIDPTPATGARGYRDGPAMVPIFQRDVVVSDGRRERVWLGTAPAT